MNQATGGGIAPFRVLITGGGSGGHVYPLLAAVEGLQDAAAAANVSLELFYIGPDDEYRNVIAGAGVRTVGVVTGKLRRYFSLLTALDAPKMVIGFAQTFFHVFRLMPDAVFSKGGAGALWVVCAAWVFRVPVVIHESDVFPGLTNALSSRVAKTVLVSFESTMEYFKRTRVIHAGNPVRRALLSKRIEPEEAKQQLGFSPRTALLLVLGGSQGSTRLNEFVILNLGELLREAQVLHQTGRAHFDEVNMLATAALKDTGFMERESAYRAAPFLEDDMPLALSAADLILARAGSGSIFEAAAFGKPAILVPLSESANDHQRRNAYEYAACGAAIVIEEKNLMMGIVRNQIRAILQNPGAWERMHRASESFFRPDAARKIAEELLRFRGREPGEPSSGPVVK
ncbi:MAG: UDP-N-acetylglucosamine--N-acetylmuramyl-(pentapeptide) pyrophosphoryl-undecaprenol N-acetylglucosamine transferase [Candidatus Liptonbacteria bacterium]|nr:UDP-N-acetylglucosamine--N-acetylmuramyl-(pentapeptide) pyrophosphoryl-undecaprenol N-acetylglucosamine transferase [Candidatus Liptonbacteria bacterium]